MTTTYADARLEARAATLGVVQTGPRTYEVDSASVPGTTHTVHAAPGEPVANWTCSCWGSSGRRTMCSHKRSVRRFLGIPHDPPPPAPRRPRTEAATMPDDAPDADLMTFRVSIPPTQSAVMQHGLDGGYRIVITTDPAEEEAVHAFVRACRGRSLRLVVVADDGEALNGALE